jgi:hypothetical protein
MHDIFISYSHKDREWVNKLANTLSDQGYKVWWDKELIASQDYSTMIEDALNSTQCILTVWSPNSVKSKWVRAESARGFNQDIMMPVLIEDAKIPIPYDSVHTVDLRHWDGSEDHKGFNDVINGIDWLLKRDNAVPPPQPAFAIPKTAKKTPESTKKNGNSWMLAVGALAIAISAGAYFLKSGSNPTSSPDPATITALENCKASNLRSSSDDVLSIVKAAGRGKIDRVGECIRLGADINAKEPGSDWTALHAAAANGNVAIARKLVATGKADLEAKTHQSMTPLYLAAWNIVNSGVKGRPVLTPDQKSQLRSVIHYLKEAGALTKTAAEQGIPLDALVKDFDSLKELLFPTN